MKLSFVTIMAIFAVASFIFAVPSTWPASSQEISLDTFPRVDPEDLAEQWLTEVKCSDALLVATEVCSVGRCSLLLSAAAWRWSVPTNTFLGFELVVIFLLGVPRLA